MGSLFGRFEIVPGTVYVKCTHVKCCYLETLEIFQTRKRRGNVSPAHKPHNVEGEQC